MSRPELLVTRFRARSADAGAPTDDQCSGKRGPAPADREDGRSTPAKWRGAALGAELFRTQPPRERARGTHFMWSATERRHCRAARMAWLSKRQVCGVRRR